MAAFHCVRVTPLQTTRSPLLVRCLSAFETAMLPTEEGVDADKNLSQSKARNGNCALRTSKAPTLIPPRVLPPLQDIFRATNGSRW